MADYIRRIVSGNKARFKDDDLDLELDLVYVTDRVIIMGYPAAGLEGLYRNRREDAKKFLETRHKKDFWVYNFCPIRENSYDASLFDGRVSRYPFPDHHAPPLAVMPLLAREMHAWLHGSDSRVAVLHCKAGKGRSGTMACAYLLALDDNPTPPRLARSYTTKEWAKIRADDVMEAIPEERQEDKIGLSLAAVTDELENDTPNAPILSPEDQVQTPDILTPTATMSLIRSSKPFTESLKDVLDLHSSRRMKAPSSPNKDARQGVSIPSQRRWLYYWSLLLEHQAPTGLWVDRVSKSSIDSEAKHRKVQLTQITLRMKEASSVKKSIVRAANLVIDQTHKGKAPTNKAHVWASLARYDDDLIDLLERWEIHTRSDTDEQGHEHMGRRKPGSDEINNEALNEIFKDSKWDEEKMVRSFARMGAVGYDSVVKGLNDKDGKITTYLLSPLSGSGWVHMKHELQHVDNNKGTVDPKEADLPVSEASSINDDTKSVKAARGVVLDAGREVRIKLYMGQVFLCWLWFIPAFHMAQPSNTSTSTPIHFVLTRKELDFPIGLGSDIIDVDICMEWLKGTDIDAVQSLVEEKDN